tara:strand:- start:164 stop:817 length:654 start_codon:yes stop_codon:yes gene_type:complete
VVNAALVHYTWIMGSQKRKASKKMTLKEAEKITGGLDLYGTSDPKKFYKNVQEELAHLFFHDRIVYTWKNLGQYAMGMYDEPQDAMDVLVANANRPFKKQDVKRFYLVRFIEEQMSKKENKDKGPRTIVTENMKICCSLNGIDFNLVSPSKTQINKKLVKRKSYYHFDHDKVVEQIIEKRRRVIDEKKKEYNRWIKEEYRYEAKEFNAYILRKKLIG